MEISAACVGWNHQSLTLLSPLPFSLIDSLSPPTIRAKSPQMTLASTTLVKEPKSAPASPNVVVTPKKRRSNSYSEKQAAIIHVQQSPDLASALERLGERLKVEDLNAILRHFGKQSRWQDLSQLFEWMLEHNKINTSTYSSYIKFMGESVDFVKALEIYNNIPDESAKNNVVVCNSILNCLVKNGKFDSSIKLFHKMKQDGLTPNTVTYTTLLAGCMKVHHGYSRALELVQELEFNGLQMDSVTYGTLLAVCASNNLCKEAESYFSKMKDEGHLPNVFHYSSLLNAYASGGSYKKAEDLVQDMRSSGMIPNKVILTTLLKVYVRGRLFEKSRKLLAELEALGYAEDEMPYCLVMDGLAKAGLIDEARSVFREIEEKCVKSDGYCYSIMISAFCRGGLLGEAMHLARDYQAKYDKYDLVMLNTILRAYCRVGEMENAMQMLKKMDELAISPDCNTFHILIKYFCKEKLYMLAYRTMEDMHSKGHQPVEELCSSLIFHLGKTHAHSEAYSVYNILRYGKRTMCKALHEKILHILIAGRLLKDAYVVVKNNAGSISQPAIKKFANAFLKLGNINLMNDVMKVIHGSGYQIGSELFQLAISRYISKPEKKELLLQLLQWMAGQGYVVDSSTRNLILKNSHLFGRQLIAEILSKQHMMSKAMRSHQKKDK